MTSGWHVFDFDGTLIRRDSTIPLAARLARHRIWRAPLAGIPALAVRFAPDPIRQQEAKCSFLSRLLVGLDMGEVDRIARCVATQLTAMHHPVSMARLRELSQSGASVIVASASPAFLVRAVFSHVPAVRVIGTEFECVSGRLTGAIRGRPCFGDAKRLALLAAIGPDPSVLECWSDSASDLPIMKLAKHRYWVASGVNRERIQFLDPEGKFADP